MTDFLNPKSMVTPGMAGALVMFLSNAICFQFPEVAPRWVALLLSFVLGGVVIAAAKLKLLPAAGFWVLNSLIIFAVAAGSAGVAAKSTASVAATANLITQALISSAFAQPATLTNTLTKAELQAQLEQAKAALAAQQQQLAAAQQQAALAAEQAKQAEAQRQALEAQRAQEAQNANRAAKENANRFFKEW